MCDENDDDEKERFSKNLLLCGLLLLSCNGSTQRNAFKIGALIARIGMSMATLFSKPLQLLHPVPRFQQIFSDFFWMESRTSTCLNHLLQTQILFRLRQNYQALCSSPISEFLELQATSLQMNIFIWVEFLCQLLL